MERLPQRETGSDGASMKGEKRRDLSVRVAQKAPILSTSFRDQSTCESAKAPHTSVRESEDIFRGKK